LLLFFLGLTGTAVGGGTKNVSEVLPEVKLPVPGNETHKKYLGLTGKAGESFTLADIQADILLIELFSMYCPFCQHEAPLVNDLYARTEMVSKTGPVVKIIGLGASNTQFEVEYFAETYDVTFPLFPDKDMSMYHALGGAGTPTFIGCRLQGDSRKIVLRRSGGFMSADDFLKKLINYADL